MRPLEGRGVPGGVEDHWGPEHCCSSRDSNPIKGKDTRRPVTSHTGKLGTKRQGDFRGQWTAVPESFSGSKPGASSSWWTQVPWAAQRELLGCAMVRMPAHHLFSSSYSVTAHRPGKAGLAHELTAHSSKGRHPARLLKGRTQPWLL